MSTLNKHIEKLCKLLHELNSSELVFLFPVEQIWIFPMYFLFLQFKVLEIINNIGACQNITTCTTL